MQYKTDSTWYTTRGLEIFDHINPRRYFGNYSIDNALLFRTGRAPWHKDYEEWIHVISPKLWLVSLASENKIEQQRWRSSRYAEPGVIAIYSNQYSNAETALLRKKQIESFKLTHGQLTRPSKKDPEKAVLDENEVIKLLNMGVCKEDIITRCENQDISSMRIKSYLKQYENQLITS